MIGRRTWTGDRLDMILRKQAHEAVPAVTFRTAGFLAKMLNVGFSISRHELLISFFANETPGPRGDFGARAMPADVSFPHVSSHIDVVQRPSRRLPLGIGLAVAAIASVGLWVGIVAGVKALFF
jgi:hypothetical protein